MSFNQSIENSLGIDIGTSSVKGVLIKREGDVLALANYVEVFTAPFIGKESGEHAIVGYSDLEKIISNILSEMKVPIDNLIVGVSSANCFVKMIPLSKDLKTENNLKEILAIELRKYLFDSPANYNISASMVESTDKDNKYLVLAIKNSVLENVNGVISKLGIKYNIQPNIFGALRLVDKDMEHMNMLVDFASNSISIAIIYKNNLIGIETLNIGVNQIINKIKTASLITFSEAKILFDNFDFNNSKGDFVQDIVKLSTEHLINEVINVRNNYELRYNIRCNMVYIGGRLANVQGADTYIKSLLNNMDLIKIDPFERLFIRDDLKELIKRDSYIFMNATGLAISSFK